jgi:KDO2-lipid IV(A) lauroyltransferase
MTTRESEKSDRNLLYFIKYGPTYLLVAMGWSFSHLPYKVQMGLGFLIGRFAYYCFPFRRKVIRANLKLCFPEWDDKKLSTVTRQHYEAIGMGLFEVCIAWWSDEKRLPPLGEWEGREHLLAAQATGRGIILLTAHFTTMELASHIFGSTYKGAFMYRRANNPVIGDAMEYHRHRRGHSMISFDRVDLMLRALRAGEMVWYAPDQARQVKDTVLAPFFGEPALTNMATVRIARAGKAVIVPYLPERKTDGGYRIRVFEPIYDSEELPAEEMANIYHKLMEEHIRRHPEQYFWIHKRFKKRPNLPDPYA